MGWDRKGENAYYSRSRRKNGRIKRQYIPINTAAAVARMDEYRMPSFIALKYVGRLEEHFDGLAPILPRDLAKLRSDLQYESSTALERLMIDRVCCCFAAHYCAELQTAGSNPERRTFTIHDDHTERLARRLERSIRVLAQVRRMRLPEIHVNLVDKQFNVVQSSHAPLTTKSA